MLCEEVVIGTNVCQDSDRNWISIG